MKNKEIFYSGDLEIGKNERNLMVTKTKKGLKIEIFSCDWGVKNITIFVNEDIYVNVNIDWTDWTDWLDEMIADGILNIYRTIAC